MSQRSTPHEDTVVSHEDTGTRDPGAPLAPGTVVAGYRIEGVAGAGGMGVVHRARDVELGRAVALKLITPGRAEDPAFRAMFVRESMAAAALEHPNVLPVYRAGEDGGRLFIAMRFVDGASLQDLIDASPGGLPPGRAARIVARVADALDAAHARGLVHRDVKPANILIADPDGDEHVYLSDFGLSTAGARVAGGAGGWVGTPGYLAPEQIRGEAVDARIDVYALGCVLHHALTGRAPFGAGEADAVLAAHLTERPPAPSAEVPGLPPGFDEVVGRAMDKDPGRRYQSAGELARAALAARYDVALLVAEADRPAAETLAAGLREGGLLPLVVAGGDPRAAEGVRASGACAVLVGRQALGEWARDGLAAARALAMRDRAFRLACVLLPGAPDAADPGLVYLAESPCVDLRADVEDALGVADLARVVRGGEVPPGRPRAGEEGAPYRGLEAFREEDADLYVGREQDIARLLEHLRGSRFVAVMGPSGSGKSSLVHAGLLPAIRRDGVAGGRGWRILEVLPGARPLAALAAQLGHLAGAGAPSAADLATDERALDMAVARALAGRPEDERVLVLVDQLEEVFTLCGDEGEREAFLGNLVYAATIPGGRVVVVVTMRADFYHRLAEHPGLRTLVASQQVLLGPIDARGLRRVIEEPARRHGLELEPGLTRRILSDVADRPGTLPLLEHLLLELWRRRRERTLTLEAYAASGGVEGALARRANEVYGALPPERQAIARRVLLRLTQPGEGTEDTRRRATRAELVTRPGEEAEVDAVVEALAEARLLTTGRDDATGEPVVEVTHEALIRGWPELRGWIDEDRDRLRAERRLSDAATEWDRGGRDDGALYRGARLTAWEERDPGGLAPVEQQFLDASRERARRERAARRRRTRVAIGALAGALVIIGGVAGYALVQRDDAADQRDASTSRALAANSQLQREGDPELALLLAGRAVAVEATPEAEEALRRAAAESAVRATIPGDGTPVWDVAVSGGGERLVTGAADGAVRVWTADGRLVRELPGDRGQVLGVAVARGGGMIAAADEDGTVRVWEEGSSGPRVFVGHEGEVSSVAFTAGADAVVSGGVDGTVRVWPLGGGTPEVISSPGGAVAEVATAADGRIAAGGDDGVLRVWDSDGRPVTALEGHEGGIFGVAFGPGGQIATASADLTVRVWRPSDDGPPRTLRAAAFSGVDDVAFGRDGRLVTAGKDGTVRIWGPDGRIEATLRGHDGEVLGARLIPGTTEVVSTGFDGTTRIWDWSFGRPLAEVPSPQPVAYQGAARYLSDGRTIISAHIDGAVREWTPGATRFRVAAPPGPAGTIGTAMAVSPDERLVATAGIDGVAVVRGLDSETPPVELKGHEGPVWGMRFTDDGETLVTAGDDGTVRIWDLATGTGTEVGDAGMVLQSLDVSPDGSLVAAGDIDGVIHLWDRDEPGAAVQLPSQEGVVFSLAFSPDGRRLVSGGGDRTVRVWDVATREATTLGEHDSAVYTTSFSRDGRLIVSTAADGPRVWDWRSGIVVNAPRIGSRAAFSAVLSPDLTEMVVTTVDDRILVIGCTTCGSLDDVRALAADHTTRDLTAAEEQAFVD